MWGEKKSRRKEYESEEPAERKKYEKEEEKSRERLKDRKRRRDGDAPENDGPEPYKTPQTGKTKHNEKDHIDRERERELSWVNTCNQGPSHLARAAAVSTRKKKEKKVCEW